MWINFNSNKCKIFVKWPLTSHFMNKEPKVWKVGSRVCSRAIIWVCPPKAFPLQSRRHAYKTFWTITSNTHVSQLLNVVQTPEINQPEGRKDCLYLTDAEFPAQYPLAPQQPWMSGGRAHHGGSGTQEVQWKGKKPGPHHPFRNILNVLLLGPTPKVPPAPVAHRFAFSLDMQVFMGQSRSPRVIVTSWAVPISPPPCSSIYCQGRAVPTSAKPPTVS